MTGLDSFLRSYAAKITDGGGPSRLEGVWWLPPGGADVRLALSNTSDAPLTVTTRPAGVGRAGTDDATIDLGPHETRVVDVRQGLRNVGAAGAGVRTGGTVRRAGVGAISVEHSGTGGPLLARAMVQDPTTGYSSTVQFSAPQKGKSSRLEGAGLRLRGASGEPLTPAVVARNVGDAATTLRGRMPYTTAGGDVRFISIAGVRLSPGEAKIIELDSAGGRSRIPPEATIAGLEFEHAGAPGSVIMAAHSMSDDGNQVYRVPMWDPLAQRSPTGGYPWYIEGNSSTTVYIKNLTRREQKYLAHLVFPGGTYVFGLKSIKGGQTVEIDLRALRDNQTPDEEGRTIPPEVSSGQIKWSLKPAAEPREDDPYESLALIGRSEQTDTARGISSNYSCQNCCTDGFLYGYIFPDGIELETGEQAQLTAYDVSQDCYGFPITSQASASWSSSNTGVVSVNGGVVTANAIGDVTITAKWYVTEHHEDPTCGGGGTFFAPTGGEAGQDSVTSSRAGGGDEIVIMAAPGCVNGCGSRYYRNSTGAAVSVKPKVTINSAQTVKDGETANFSVTVQGGTATAYLWTFEAPSDAGNNPSVPFSSTTIHNPTAKAHWFAKPNDDCTAACTSQYKIKCKVTFTGGKTVTKETSLTVDGCWVPAGQVNPNTARVVGAPQQIVDANGVWRVGNMGTLRRQLPTKEVFVPSTSQFFAETDAHEEEHIKHWAVGDLLGDVHDPAVFYARIQNVTGTSQMDLIEKLSAELTTYTNEQGAIYESRRVESERRAHAVSDPIAPLYLYNNCGRY